MNGASASTVIATIIRTPVRHKNTASGVFSASSNGVLAYQEAGSPPTSHLTWYDRHGKVVSECKHGSYHGAARAPGGLTLIGNDDRRCVEVVAPEGNVRLRLEVEGWPWYVRYVP